MAVTCAAACADSQFTNNFTEPCDLLGSRVIAMAITLCGVTMACPTVKEDIEAQITANTLKRIAPVNADWSAPTHNYADVNFSYLPRRKYVDTTYALTVYTPYTDDNDPFMDEINDGKYKELALITEDGPTFKPRTNSGLSITVGTGLGPDGNLCHIFDISFTQKKGTLKGYKGRAPLYVAEDE